MMEVLYVLDFLSTLKIDSCNSITDVVMFDGALTVHISGELFKIHYPKVSVMSGVEHTVSLFFNDVFKIPVVNQMITAHYAMYKLFSSGIYHKPHYILKSKPYDFYNRNIGLFSENDTKIDFYFIGMQRDLRMRKSLITTVSSSVFNTMSLKLKKFQSTIIYSG